MIVKEEMKTKQIKIISQTEDDCTVCNRDTTQQWALIVIRKGIHFCRWLGFRN